jgi:hypothetical protein
LQFAGRFSDYYDGCLQDGRNKLPENALLLTVIDVGPHLADIMFLLSCLGRPNLCGMTNQTFDSEVFHQF